VAAAHHAVMVTAAVPLDVTRNLKSTQMDIRRMRKFGQCEYTLAQASIMMS
jgi:hypothetical protein